MVVQRPQYNRAVAGMLRRLVPPGHVDAVLAGQYPKTTDQVLAELVARGLNPGHLPRRDNWTAEEVDAIAAALSGLGLTGRMMC